GYAGGEDGTGYYLQTPSSFKYEKSEPVYKDSYGEAVKGALDAVTKTEPFSYDYKSDPVYSAYKKEYTREGKRASEDTLGSFAAATGGIPSSYAVTAASQAGDYYAAQLSDKIPELYEAAYGRYLDEYNRKRDTYDVLRTAEQDEYSRYLDELARYDSEKADAYSKFTADTNAYENRETAKAQAEFEKQQLQAAADQQAFENSLSEREMLRKENADASDAELALLKLELQRQQNEFDNGIAERDMTLKEQVSARQAYKGSSENQDEDETEDDLNDEYNELSEAEKREQYTQKMGQLLRRVSSLNSDEEKEEMILRWLDAGTITGTGASYLLKKLGLYSSEYDE
ncbi:MAG: hypothetical protein ACI4RV_06395, partial [Eubacteriales bacterium]